MKGIHSVASSRCVLAILYPAFVLVGACLALSARAGDTTCASSTASVPLCDQPNNSCKECIVQSATLKQCKTSDREKHGPVYETKPTGAPNICWEQLSSVPCYTNCTCNDSDEECNNNDDCSILHHSCNTTTTGPVWVQVGTCVNGECVQS